MNIQAIYPPMHSGQTILCCNCEEWKSGATAFVDLDEPRKFYCVTCAGYLLSYNKRCDKLDESLLTSIQRNGGVPLWQGH